MRRSDIPLRSWICAALAVVALHFPYDAQAQPAPVLVRHGERAFVVLPSGEETALPFVGIAALAAVADGFVAAGVGEDGELELVRADEEAARSGRLEPLPAPDGSAGAMRREPVLLVEDGSLVGLAWLEGGQPTRLAVRSARWNGEAWEPAAEVAPPGPGSQLALAGAVLADGSWLLLWSAFDGEDDEIEWSRGDGAHWSPPRRLAADNRVPDVTPAVVATAGGALAAWSRYEEREGQYRVVVSHLDRPGGGWSEPRPLGPPGSLFPTLDPLPAASGARVVFRTARPRGWQVMDLDADGRPRRTAAVAAATAAPPHIEADASGVRFEWPGARGAEAVHRDAAWENLP